MFSIVVSKKKDKPILTKPKTQFCIIGNKGDYGKFIGQYILKYFRNSQITGFDIDSNLQEKQLLLRDSNHIINCVSLKNYHSFSLQLLTELESFDSEKYLWLCATLQWPTIRAIQNFQKLKPISKTKIISLHTMYGPNTFQFTHRNNRKGIYNIYTYGYFPNQHVSIKTKIKHYFERFGIKTLFDYDAESHDAIICRSQGLVFIFALELMAHKSLKDELARLHPILFQPFEANWDLMNDFANLNHDYSYVKQVFLDFLTAKKAQSLLDFIRAFQQSDSLLNGKKENPIPTHSYLYLRAIKTI